YRTIDGTCNNLCRIKQGAASTPLRRFLPSEYADEEQPRNESVTGHPLPNTRRVSVEIFQALNGDEFGIRPIFTHVTMTWGQFIDHDVTLTELTPNVECGNNTTPTEFDCRRIFVNVHQSASDKLAVVYSSCLFGAESYSDQRERKSINEITAYIDASQVYGSDEALAQRLRDKTTKLGLLDVRPYINSDGEPILPEANEEAFCRSTDTEASPCFLAGDIRVNENHALMAMHTIWVREHNRIANFLHLLNPHWGDERLYQEARKIVGAEIQHITYNEWLAVIFASEDLREKLGLLLEPKGKFFKGYNVSVDAQCTNAFSTAALRMGHSLIRDTFFLLDTNFGIAGFDKPNRLETRDFFNPDRFYQAGDNAYGGILLGLIRFFAQNVDRRFVRAVRERLIIEGEPPNGIVGDLTAINMIRGRDHGLPGYVKFREACGGKPAVRFDDICDTIPRAQVKRLKSAGIYKRVQDIDLFAGGMSEKAQRGSALGFTFTCLVGRQFKDFRHGDRFWYERDDHKTGFTIEQLDQIRHSSLAKVICDNTDDVRRIHEKVFVHRNTRGANNPVVDCDDLPFMDLTVFKEGEHY
ncbi:unnamed protein product, partial [Porites lobata]